MNWEKLYLDLSFAVENKIGISHKNLWSNFKLSVNDWDIPVAKILRIYQ